MNQIKLIKLTRELPFHLCTFPRWSLCTWLPVEFDRCCLQAYRHIAGTVSNRPVHRVHTIRRRNRLPRSPTLSDLCVSMCISVLSNQQSYPCIRCDKTSCSSDPLKRRINRCTRENVCSEKRNNCIKEQCYFLPSLFIELDLETTATAGLSLKFVEPGPYDSAIIGTALYSLVARRTEPPLTTVKSALSSLIAFKQSS